MGTPRVFLYFGHVNKHHAHAPPLFLLPMKRVYNNTIRITTLLLQSTINGHFIGEATGVG